MSKTVVPSFAAVVVSLGLIGVIPSAAAAGPNPYLDGVVNPVTYSSTAAVIDDVIAYFTGTGAAYTESVNLFDNDVLTSTGFGRNNHSSTPRQSLNFGSVIAGDILVFAASVTDPNSSPLYVYSDPGLNGPYDCDAVGAGVSHVYYSTAYTGDNPPWAIAGILASTYVGFKNIPTGTDPDCSYADEAYMFGSDSAAVNSPEPLLLSLLGVGLIGLGAMQRRRSRFNR